MEIEIWAALIGIVGSGLIGWAIYAAQSSVAQASATMELLKEFNGPAMSESRARARRYVIQNIDTGFADMEKTDTVPPEGLSAAEHLYVVMRFYHRLNALRESNLLKEEKLLQLFGYIYAYWWKFSFEPQMERSDNWRTKEDLRRLYFFFKSRAASTGQNKVWGEWLAEGESERKGAQDQKKQIKSGT